jgi:hypothetical protein
VLRRQRAERGLARRQVVDDLAAASAVDAAGGRSTSLDRRRRTPPRVSRAATSSRRRDTANDSSSLRPGASPSQNGMFGGAPLASSTRTRPRSTAQDAVAGVAELEDVAGHALDGEVLVDRADRSGLRLQHHLVVGGVGNGAARGQRRQRAPRRRAAVVAPRRDAAAPRAARRVVKPSASMRTTASKRSRVPARR